MIYVLQFDRPLGNERHQAHFYLGWCADGTLARIVERARRAQIAGARA